MIGWAGHVEKDLEALSQFPPQADQQLGDEFIEGSPAVLEEVEGTVPDYSIKRVLFYQLVEELDCLQEVQPVVANALEEGGLRAFHVHSRDHLRLRICPLHCLVECGVVVVNI